MRIHIALQQPHATYCVSNRVRFSWELGPEDGAALAGGVDFGVLVDSRLQSITGFLDFVPSASGE
jgi:hypothetical protein